MSIDAIGDFLTVIRNAVLVSKAAVVVPFSKIKQAIASILKEEGFILDFAVIKEGNSSSLKLFFKYVDGESPIHEITRCSKLSRRKYAGAKAIKPVSDGLGISILTTNRGVVTNKRARELGVGGEIICTVW